MKTTDILNEIVYKRHDRLTSEYKQVASKYPLISCSYFCVDFVSDLPVNLTSIQLSQLIDLSFSAAQKQMILNRRPRHMRDEVATILDTNKGWGATWIKDKINDEVEVMSHIVTWKEYIEYIKSECIRLGGDFKE